jgi:hypothetical protein
VEERVVDVSLLDSSAPFLPLAWYVAAGRPIEIDRLYVGASYPMTSLTVESEPPCVRVESAYRVGDGSAFVTQLHDCDLDQPTDGSPFIDDGTWEVTVSGDGADGLRDDLAALPFTDVAAWDAVPFDAGAMLDDRLSLRDVREIIRLPWRDGLVSIADSDEAPYAVETLVAIEGGFNGGGAGSFCQEYAVGYWSDDVHGFGYAVTQSADMQVSFTDPAASIVLVTTDDGRGAGLVDLPGDLSSGLTSWTVLDADGTPSPCTQ